MFINQNFEGENFRIVRPHEVQNRLGVSRAKFADMVAKGQFPKPFTIIPGGRAVGWLGEDVDAWIIQRAQEVVS